MAGSILKQAGSKERGPRASQLQHLLVLLSSFPAADVA